MKLFVCTLLVAMVVLATLIDDSEGWRRRRRRRRSRGLDVDTDVDSELREVVEEARSLLEELDERPGQPDTRGLEDVDLENIFADNGEVDSELREVVEEARSLLKELDERPGQPDTRGLEDVDLENIFTDNGEADSELKEAVEEARSLLEELDEQPSRLHKRLPGLISFPLSRRRRSVHRRMN
ncbi:uncharacterized protein [Branchiostoma lanceolatum]|uniref:uncharacterized protein isoform X3 n=1 Tax=Branchiostoma lanceolatum TaxID=7740 RepID=UPI003456663E